MFDAEKNPQKDDHIDIEENTGFAIVVNGHSLVYCLSPELESKYVHTFNFYFSVFNICAPTGSWTLRPSAKLWYAVA